MFKIVVGMDNDDYILGQADTLEGACKLAGGLLNKMKDNCTTAYLYICEPNGTRHYAQNYSFAHLVEKE